jgi:DNA primase large subunit
MDIALDHKELVKYPFLKESQYLARKHVESLEEFLASPPGAAALDRGKERVVAALTVKREFSEREVPTLKPELEIAGYALARILASCIGDRIIVDRLARYEAERASFYLRTEEAEKRRYVARSIGIDIEASAMQVVDFVELASGMREVRWRLVNRDVRQGQVRLESGEMDELLRERIRAILAHQLPLRVPSGICEQLAPAVCEITLLYQQQILEQFGEVKEEAFPPCINSLIEAITAGTNLTHMGRFAITAFLHTIGMGTTEIAEVFARAPDFDVEKTMYQVEHISGRGGTEYTPPSCATMRTFGLCSNRDKYCEKVNHPLSYYRFKKNPRKKQG